MNSKTVDLLAPRAVLALLALTATLASPLSQAQQVYRITGPDGKVTFSDQPPPPTSNAKVSEVTSTASSSAQLAGLPFELRQAAQKYPVTLYTGENCQPCSRGRALLSSRGIPFSERTVLTPADGQALQRMSGDSTLPFLTIGSQQLKGFSDAEWTQFLTAAGYPATSVLPSNYRAPSPTPVVSVAEAPAATASGPKRYRLKQEPAPAPVTPVTSPDPSGIRF